MSEEKRNELFIRSIPLNVTQEDLENFFSDFAPVKHAVIVKDPATKQSKGFGFVSFASPKDATAVFDGAKNKKIDGKLLRIEYAKPRARKPDAPAPESTKVERRRPRLIVRNVPWSLRDPKELETIFSKYGKVMDALIPRGENKKMSGFAFVTMRRKLHAEKAVAESKGLEIHGRPVAVDFAVTKEQWLSGVKDADESDDDEDSEEEDDGDSEGEDQDDDEDEDDDDDEGEASGDEADSEAEQEPEPKPKRRALSDEQTVFVRNLPYDATAEALVEHFSHFGPVSYALPVIDKKLNQPKGVAFVAFKYPDSCEKCLAGAPALSSSSLLLPDDVDASYVFEGRVLSISQAVSQGKAESLAQKGAEERQKAMGKEPPQKDRRNLFLLNEGRVTTQSKLAELLSASDMKIRDKSYEMRKKQLSKNASLHLSLTRLAIRNLPRAMDQKALKALGRKAIVEFAKEVREKKRQPLSKEEIQRSQHFEELHGEKTKSSKGKGVVKQAKIVQEIKGSGETGRSRGYGFLEMKNHKLALMALRWLNCHQVSREEVNAKEDADPADVKERRRLVVEFSVENAQVVRRQQDRHLRDKQFGKMRKDKAEAEEKAQQEAEAAAQKEKLSKGSAIVGRKRALKRKRN